MALVEDRVLVSVQVNIEAKTIDALWMDRILKNGVVISSTPHRGAFPLNESGEPDTDLGKSLKNILGEAGAEAQKKVKLLEAQLEEKDFIIQKYADDINDVQHQVSLANEDKAERVKSHQLLNSELSSLRVEYDHVQNDFKVCQELNEKLVKDRDTLKDKVENLITELESCRSDWEQAQDEIATLKAELKEAKDMAADLKETTTALEEKELTDAGTH